MYSSLGTPLFPKSNISQPRLVTAAPREIHNPFRIQRVHARRKLRNFLWRRQSTIAGDRRGGRWQILSMAGITASDVDEVIALLFQEGEGWFDRFGDRTFGAGCRGAAATPSRIPLVLRNTKDAGYFAIATLACQHCSRFAVALCCNVGAFAEEQFDHAAGMVSDPAAYSKGV